MKIATNVTMRSLFTEEEREIIRRASYAEGVEDHIADNTNWSPRALVRGRAKALQGDTGHGQGNAYTAYELYTLSEAVKYAIEWGVMSDDEYEAEPWDATQAALEDAADTLVTASNNADRSDIHHRKRYAEGYQDDE